MMMHKSKNKPMAFAFVVMKDEEASAKLIELKFIKYKDQELNVSRALTKKEARLVKGQQSIEKIGKITQKND